MEGKFLAGLTWAVLALGVSSISLAQANEANQNKANQNESNQAGQTETSAPKKLSIIRMTPTGTDISETRQIILEFNRPVVPLGKMERSEDEVGIKITPSLKCQWRWINRSTLACNLDEKDAVQPSTNYQLSVTPVITAEDGGRLKETENYNFTTMRAKIYDYDFQTWRGPATPVLRVVFNQPVSKSSVENHIYFTDKNKKSRWKISASQDTEDQDTPEYIWIPQEKIWIKIGEQHRKSHDEKTDIKGEEARSVWMIEPQKPLPPNQEIKLSVEEGIVSALGPEWGEEQRELTSFNTFPDFELAVVRCYDKDDEVLYLPIENEKVRNEKIRNKKVDDQQPAKLCNPLSAVSLGFTAPVLRSQVKKHARFTPDLAGGRKDFSPWGDENRDNTDLDFSNEFGKLYYITLPFGLKAAQSYRVDIDSASHDSASLGPKSPASVSPASDAQKSKLSAATSTEEIFQDQFGRRLSEPVHFTFSTSHRNPNFELPYENAVLEKQIESDIPFYVNNLNSYRFDYNAITADGIMAEKTYEKSLVKIDDIQYGVPLGVREILGHKSGAVYGTIKTKPAVENSSADTLFAQITPWQAHFKLGHFSSLVWVSDLATGQPVEGVKVTLYKGLLKQLSLPQDIITTATTNHDGIAILPGSSSFDPVKEWSERSQDDGLQLLVRLDKDSDMALLPLNYNFQLSLWNFSDSYIPRYTEQRYGHLKSWGTSAQGIYRTGDTMQYKIFLRDQNNQTLIAPPKGKYSLEISDPMDKIVKTIENISFSEFGAYAGEYKIPENAAVGWYDFTLKAEFSDPDIKADEKISKRLSPMKILVADFTPAPFRVETEIGAQKLHDGDHVTITSRASLHSGGAYADAALRTTATFKNIGLSPKSPALKGFIFNSFAKDGEFEQIFQKSAMLNDKGEWSEKITFTQHPDIYFAELEVESAVQDDRGKSIASTAHAPYYGVDRFVGLKSPEWFYETKKPVTLQTAVMDENEKIISGTKIHIKLEREDISVAKVKSAGNAYLNDITREWKEEKKWDLIADGITDFSFTPDTAGSYRATAEIKDSKGRTHNSEISFWVSGDNYVQWNDQDKLQLPVISEKNQYQVGETAKFLVKNPYPGATALITVERYGVMDHFLKKLEGSSPILEIPVKADYLPGFYLSVMVISPRVDMPPPELGQIDLGKPSFRMGYVSVPVVDPYKEIKVNVKAEQQVYRPRDKVKVSLQATPLHPTTPNEPIEIAVAVLDESVFDLIGEGKKAFDPYQGFYGLDDLDVRNYSMLYRLVGKQKFEKKGANPGGDGGFGDDLRTLFKYVSYWNPSVKTDSAGKAEIEFDAPDNLTGWRVLAIATTPTDRMGLGEGEFKVNRPTELRPVMPNQVREDDAFTSGFSVMNRTDKTREIKVSITASGTVAASTHDATAPTDTNTPTNTNTIEKTIVVAPYKRVIVPLPLKAGLIPINRDIPQGEITFKATAADDLDHDGVEYKLPVLKKRVIDVSANYGTTTENKIEESIAFPQNIYSDVGNVSLTLSPSVIANIEGAFRYMRDYPYMCWEQTLTKGVMAANYKELKAWMPDQSLWQGADTLPKTTLERSSNYQAPNGGMAYFLASDEHTDPYLSAYTALAFHWLKKDGYDIPKDVETKLHNYLLNFLRKDASPEFYDKGMTSTVRAVALAALAQEGKIDSSDVKRYEPHLKDMSLFGKSQFLEAALVFPDTKDAAKEAVNMIFASGSETSGKFMFSETLDDGYLRILATPLRDNCAILSSFMHYSEKGGAELIGDKPFKLVRMITQSRGRGDYWENTQENMFCMAALVDYARRYERTKPNMTVTATLDQRPLGETGFHDFKDQAVALTRAITEEDIGKNRTVFVNREGDGRLYYSTKLSYAPKTGWQNHVNAGMDITREYSVRRDGVWQLLKPPMVIKRGESVRVDLYLSVPTARNFVVVNDPVPGGLETVNRDLKTSSNVDDQAAQFDQSGGSLWFKYGDWNEYGISLWSFYHRELRHDSARFYADWLPGGNYHLSYMTQAIAAGTFAAPPVRAEEMYDADIYGRGDDAVLTITSE
ncbi:MAG: large extracellular alpha-helical protein [Alphaproteobacteria bacterium]|nr:large extracellular alpha-helical protein [Alphaproteobacteria bacterium]